MSDDLDEALDRIEDAYEEGDLKRARKELARARKRFPGDPVFAEWEGTIALDEGRPKDALDAADRVLAREPGRPFATRLRSEALIDLGRFEEALQAIDSLAAAAAGDESVEDEDEAALHHDRGLCLDRLGRPEDADREFRKAERLAPEEFPAPERMPAGRFEALVVEALDGIPSAFDSFLRQVAVVVRDYPTAGMDVDPFSLGLYSGVPRTERAQETRNNLDSIFIFKRNHELLGLDRDGLREEVRKTVVHEIAHHFGFGEEDMGEYA